MLKINEQVKYIIAVASGKGGVGKSTVAVNLALALAAAKGGARVGLLDADIYGPNQPKMLGISDTPELSKTSEVLKPIVAYGIESMSIGYLIDAKTPTIWRAPMATNALLHLLNGTAWSKLDYLIIDLPPGTGDIQLTLAQKIPLSGAVIVTTPQEIALLDVRKAIAMLNKVKVPLLGVIENMSHYKCTHCGHVDFVFNSGGGGRVAKEWGLDLLGSLVLDPRVSQQADRGHPIFLSAPQSLIALSYRSISEKLIDSLSKQSKNYSSRFPKIVIEEQ